MSMGIRRGAAIRSLSLIGATVVGVALLAGCSSSSPQPSKPVSSSAVASSAPASSVAVSSSPVVSSAPATASSLTRALPTSSPLPKTTVTTTKKPSGPADPLTGLAASSNPVIAVKIDNTFFDVAQFGVSDADIVFVEQVEGGLTRLIGVFHSNLKVEVGPVRSVRSTDAELLPVFGKPALVFSGGAGGPLSALAQTDVIDASGFNGYFRSTAAYGTYNLHANLSDIEAQAQQNGIGKVQSIGFKFAASDARVAAGPKISAVTVTWPSATTNFSWSGGHYVRQRNGEAVSDYQGQKEQADNLLVLHVQDEPDGTVDTNGQPSYLTHTVGSGDASLFRDGHEITGTWSRSSANEPFEFKDAKGNALPFKPGKTWVMLPPQSASVSTS